MTERKAIDRSEVIAEAYPGAANDVEAHIGRHGGLVCEQHPDREWPHDDCAGPGMVRDEPPR
jgi:hypothetical protein